MKLDPFIKGNSKMGPRVLIFNLPPVQTCTPTEWCLRGRGGKPACYALRNNFRLPNVVGAAESRHAFSQSPEFVGTMVDALRRKPGALVRFHSSGDFYSAEYVRKVMEITRACPDVSFRTTTHRRDLRGPIVELAGEPNFVVRESLDPSRPDPALGLPFAATDRLPVVAATPDVIRCSNDCVECGYACWRSRRSMCFVEH